MTHSHDDQTSSQTLRLFLCIEMPESIKARLGELQSELRRLDAPASWVKPANIHLTLKFFGDVPTTKIPDIIAATRHAIGSCSPFQVTIGGTGVFPSARKPAVLWVGFSQLPEPLMRLHQSLEDELAKAGFARESKRFNPHLTIARLRQPRHAHLLADALLAKGFAEESFTAQEIILMRSQLSPQGSLYTRQAILPFQN
ncbi:MAG: RNA 2',3'-cyclic phosphodiesterase [Acidobacteria bacterium]|nr:RNA 2',3'-cyclic phosphodiesterase [Acidobacteriota bacterium]